MVARDTFSVLLVESHTLVAMAVEDELNDAGFARVKIASSCREATEYLGIHTPDVVILDTELTDGPTTEVVHALNKRSIPFMVHSGGWLAPSEQRSVYAEGKWINKPCRPGELISHVKDCLRCA